MIETNIANLKAKLSFFLGQVKTGHEVLVLERKHPIAKLSAFPKGFAGIVITQSKRPASAIRAFKGMAPKQKVNVVELLREDRIRR